MHEDYIYVGKHKITIEKISIGGTKYIAYVKNKYRATHKGKALPAIRKAKHDIFNGNVYDVFGFMFVYISISVLIVFFAVLAIWSVYCTPCTADNTIEQQTSFTSCITHGDKIILTSSDNKLYKILIGKEFHSAEIETICDGKTILTTYSKEITPDSGDNYYSVKAILYEDTYLISFDQTNRWYQERNRPVLIFPIFFAIVWGVYIAGSIIVGRNPKKYGKKVVKLFFKNGYVKY